jgi:hypothetical protein
MRCKTVGAAALESKCTTSVSCSQMTRPTRISSYWGCQPAHSCAACGLFAVDQQAQMRHFAFSSLKMLKTSRISVPMSVSRSNVFGSKSDRTARKPAHNPVSAAKEKLASVSRPWRHARMRVKADAINFHSGLNDSANLLYGLVRSMKPEVCVEIGSGRGMSACYVGMALRQNGRGKLYAIDPHMPT